MNVIVHEKPKTCFEQTAQYINKHPALKVALIVSGIALMILASTTPLAAVMMGVVAGVAVKALIGTAAAGYLMSAAAIGKAIHSAKTQPKNLGPLGVPLIGGKPIDELKKAPTKATIMGPINHSDTKKKIKETTHGLANITYKGDPIDMAGKKRPNMIKVISKRFQLITNPDYSLKAGDPISTFIGYMAELPRADFGIDPIAISDGKDVNVKLGKAPTIEVTEANSDVVKYIETGKLEFHDPHPPAYKTSLIASADYEMKVTIKKGTHGGPTETTMVRKIIEPDTASVASSEEALSIGSR